MFVITKQHFFFLELKINCKIPKGHPEAETDETMDKRKRTKRQTMIYKTQHRKLTIEQHEHHKQSGMNSGVPEW